MSMKKIKIILNSGNELMIILIQSRNLRGFCLLIYEHQRETFVERNRAYNFTEMQTLLI